MNKDLRLHLEDYSYSKAIAWNYTQIIQCFYSAKCCITQRNKTVITECDIKQQQTPEYLFPEQTTTNKQASNSNNCNSDRFWHHDLDAFGIF